jgi:glucose-6-phosphate 1-dehydrogenase
MDHDAYQALISVLSSFQERYFYLATPPAMYHVITEALAHHGLFQKGNPHHRIAYEKPFGENGSSAKVLNHLLKPLSEPFQLFRVDHYLAKGFLQDLLAIRKSYPLVNGLFTDDHLAKVEVIAHETLGILSRGKFYDAIGALHDMVQSHLLQTLALAIMPIPKTLSVKAIQDHKFKFIASLVPDHDRNQFGQYAGYLQEAHVKPDSGTETFVRLYFSSSLPTLKHTRFMISTGKKLAEKKTEIHFIFHTGARIILSLYPTYQFKIDDT